MPTKIPTRILILINKNVFEGYLSQKFKN